MVALALAPRRRTSASTVAMAFEMSLECRDLTVRRAGRDVLAGAGFALTPGQVLMVRGANGSGKTSLLRALAGLAQAEGEIIFRRGIQVLDAGYIRAEEIHYIGVEPGLSSRLTVEENADFIADFYGGTLRDSLRVLGLHRLGQSRAGQLSSGQRKRLSFLRLIVSPRALWLLDEPFAALDDEGQDLVRSLIDGHCSRGGVAVIALHEQDGIPGARTITVKAA
ncbi:MAG: heme ABC exporter ATP-binding protein CcmA [Pseudomonadota bacterium]